MYESFKNICETYGINYETARSYKNKHPELTIEQVIQHYITPKEKSFAQKCRDAGVNTSTASSYKRNHPELSDEQIIAYCSASKEDSLAKKCDDANVSYSAVVSYKSRHKVSDEESINACINIKNNKDTVKEKEINRTKNTSYIIDICKQLNMCENDIKKVTYILSKQDVNAENAIISVKLNDKSLLTSKISFLDKYRAFNLKTGINTVRSLRGKERFKDYTDLQVIAYYVQKEAESTEEYSLRQMCMDAGINYNTASGVKRRNPELTNRQIIDSIIQSELNSKYYVIIQGIRKEFDNIKQALGNLEIDYQLVMQRKSSNKCSTEQAILYYRPDCYINWLGELVIPN